ncbi:MAG TPA: hypothetical protein VMT80_01610 [Candidatus Paceibacterota bacterium]|nr:hypothetical protein [Candidatus Paceibacterota bacterium]
MSMFLIIAACAAKLSTATIETPEVARSLAPDCRVYEVNGDMFQSPVGNVSNPIPAPALTMNECRARGPILAQQYFDQAFGQSGRDVIIALFPVVRVWCVDRPDPGLEI